MASVMIGLCVVATVIITAMSLVRWYRNPEYLRWLRIEKRARVRAAAVRAAARYASIPSITVAPPLVPSVSIPSITVAPPLVPSAATDERAA